MSEHLSSPHNRRIKEAAALRDRKARTQRAEFLIDGLREIARAAEGGIEIVEAFVLDDDERPDAASNTANQTKSLAEARTLLERLAVRLTWVSSQAMAKLAYGDRAEGIVAVAKIPQRILSEYSPPSDALIAVVEQVEKPGNLGAILRSADAAGIAAVIAANIVPDVAANIGTLRESEARSTSRGTSPGVDLYNPNVIRASLGALFTMPVFSATSREAIAFLNRHRFRIVAARVDGAVEYDEASYAGRTAIVLGSEAQGLSAAWNFPPQLASAAEKGKAPESISVRLPMEGKVDSLNVSATAAILFFEARRQRKRGVKA